jgi:hypothetical protein
MKNVRQMESTIYLVCTNKRTSGCLYPLIEANAIVPRAIWNGS